MTLYIFKVFSNGKKTWIVHFLVLTALLILFVTFSFIIYFQIDDENPEFDNWREAIKTKCQ